MEASPHYGIRPDKLLGVVQNELVPVEDLSPVEVAQRAASQALPEYEVVVEKRRPHRDLGSNEYGAFSQQSVRYSDGAVRLVTIGIPRRRSQTSPYVVSSGDPWLTGPSGFNKTEIENLVKNGFPVVWNHHHGRHATLPTNKARIKTTAHFLSSKSTGKGAAHEHALLDDLESTDNFNTVQVYRKGYSRSGMTGEAFIALAERSERTVLWSDIEAVCFAKGVGKIGLAKILARQIPHEIKAVAGIAKDLVTGEEVDDTEAKTRLTDYLGTFDAHPLNAAHELAWINLLINGDAGVYMRALPIDARGIRTIYKHDYMSQEMQQTEILRERPGIAVVCEDGAHLSGASAEMRRKKDQRWHKLGQYTLQHEGDLKHLTSSDVLSD